MGRREAAMIFPRYYGDVESFKEYCWWWVDIKQWVDENMPTGWVFKEAYDIHQDAKAYLVIFRSLIGEGTKKFLFELRDGTLVVSENR